MGWKEYFIVGLKLIGVYCLLRGIEDIFHVFPHEFKTLLEWGQLHVVFKFAALISMASPFAMGVLGLYLIRDGSRLHDIPTFNDGIDERGWVVFGIVLFGVYLLASVVPDVLRILPDLAIVLQAPSYVGTGDALNRLKSTAALTSIQAFVGTVCILRGQDIAASAFKRENLQKKGLR